jgi:hypothetical protein
MDQDNCRAAIRRLEAKRALRFDSTGRCFAAAKPQVVPGERPEPSLRTSGQKEARLPKDVAKRLKRELAALPEEVRTNFFSRALRVRTDFLGNLKELRYKEKRGYDDLCTEARNLISLQIQNSDGQTSSSSALPDSDVISTTTANEPATVMATAGRAAAGAADTGPSFPAQERQNLHEALTRIFVEAGKPAPTPRQLAAAASALPPEAHQPYLDHLQAKIDRVRHPGVLESDVAAYVGGWPVEKERRHSQQATTETARRRQQQREQAEAVERQRWVKEELLPDRYADPKEAKRILDQYPELRGYNPRPEHVRAVDARHVRHALQEIRRANCPPEIKQEQHRRLEELERIWPGIVADVKLKDTS